MSCILFMVRAFEIKTAQKNTAILVRDIILTLDGNSTSATGVYINGASGTAWFKGDVTMDSLLNFAVLGTNASGKLIASTSGAVYNFISGFALSGPT